MEVPALHHVSVEFSSGEFSALAGPSGSGKSTLLNLVGCIDKPDSGVVAWEGQDLASLDCSQASRFRREHLGFIFQNFNLVPVLTAYENVALVLHLLGWAKPKIKEQTMQTLAELGVAELANRIPGRMSGGQQQRVAIARALVKRPALVLADEPTANLDSATGEKIVELMKDMNRRYGTSFLFSTHDPMVMACADRVVHLRDGRITEDQRRLS
jgi:putative ABC transport system ATP-binding protein